MIRPQAKGVPQRFRELPAGRVPVHLGLRQGLGHDGIHRQGQLRTAFDQGRRRLVQVRPDGREAVVTMERRAAGQQLEHRAGQRVLVCPAVDRQALDLLRCGVVGGAEELPGRGEPQRDLRALAQPEVRQVDVLRPSRPPVQQDVRGLDVTVHQADGVRGVQRGRYRGDDRRDPLGGQRSLTAQQRADVPALHEAHRDEQHLPGLAGLVDRDDVRVVHGCRRPRLPDEALPEHVVGAHRGGHDLQRHEPVQALVARAEDNGHPARADLLLEPVSTQ